MIVFQSARVHAQPESSKGSGDWEKMLEAAKKEGRVVAAIPTSAELRKELESGFQAKFPRIELEVSVSRGASNTNKIVEEQNAGVRGTDLHIGGTTSIVTALLARKLLEPVLPAMVLPEVSEPKNWWGGHIWADNAKRFIYSFTAYVTETLWYNTTLAKADEITSYDQLLDPKWKGKIAILDPRTAGSGESTWGFLWKIKGEEFLKKLAQQEMMIGRNQRQLAEALARGKSAISIGVSYYTLLPFIKSGLPVTRAVPQRRLLCRHGQRESRSPQEPSTSERDENLCELVFIQRRTGRLFEGTGATDPAFGRRHSSQQRVRLHSGERRADAGEVLRDREQLRGSGHESARTGDAARGETLSVSKSWNKK